MTMDIKKLREENAKEAIIIAIELMGLKNPNKIEKIKDVVYSHTNTVGRTRNFTVTNGVNDYMNNYYRKGYKLHRVNGFYIAEN